MPTYTLHYLLLRTMFTNKCEGSLYNYNDVLTGNPWETFEAVLQTSIRPAVKTYPEISPVQSELEHPETTIGLAQL